MTSLLSKTIFGVAVSTMAIAAISFYIGKKYY